MRKVEVTDGCWIWKGATRDGYGAFKVNGETIAAHRFAYESFRGEIPNGFVLLHECDNRPCVNPLHLTAGTQQENVRDMHAKNRWRRRN